MQIQIVNNEGHVIWMRGNNIGITCRKYLENGIQEEIIQILKEGLHQAVGELSLFNNTDRGSNCCCSPS